RSSCKSSRPCHHILHMVCDTANNAPFPYTFEVSLSPPRINSSYHNHSAKSRYRCQQYHFACMSPCAPLQSSCQKHPAWALPLPLAASSFILASLLHTKCSAPSVLEGGYSRAPRP